MARTFMLKMGLLAFFLSGPTAMAAMVSTMGNVNAVFEDRGFRLVPVSEMSIPGDEAAARVYEIVRPRGEKIRIGRLNTSCSCIRVEATKEMFERGERAFVTLRNVRATPPNGQDYAFYVQITSPIKTTLRFDLFLQSDRFRQGPPYDNASLAMQPQPYQYQQPVPYSQPYAQPYSQPYPQPQIPPPVPAVRSR